MMFFIQFNLIRHVVVFLAFCSKRFFLDLSSLSTCSSKCVYCIYICGVVCKNRTKRLWNVWGGRQKTWSSCHW